MITNNLEVSRHHLIPKYVCKLAGLEHFDFGDNVREVPHKAHVKYHVLFGAVAPWEALTMLKEQRFYSTNAENVERALEIVFGTQLSVNEQCLAIKTWWTPRNIPQEILDKLWGYGLITRRQISRLRNLPDPESVGYLLHERRYDRLWNRTSAIAS